MYIDSYAFRHGVTLHLTYVSSKDDLQTGADGILVGVALGGAGVLL